jgi:hypothetical protein
MKKQLAFLGILIIAAAASGCAISDYDGFPGHQTASEAKLWGQEVSFTGTGDPNLDGTYAYTVRYNNRSGHDVNLRIQSYRNPVPSSFSRDGQIDRDGDDVQGRKGILGGTFSPIWTATDPLDGCQFDLTRIQRHGGAPAVPPVLLCATVNEEIDKDLELQASFASFGDLISQLWSGAVTGGFSAELTGLRLGGADIALAQPISINAVSNGVRPTRISVDLSGGGGQALLQAILGNTQDGVPVSVGLSFAGGMVIDLPKGTKAAFSHAALADMLQ